MKEMNKTKKLKKFTSKMQAKLMLVFCVIIIGIIALIIRIVYLNVDDGEKYKKRVLSQQTYSSSVLPFKRGEILDRKGTVLATSQKVYNLILDPKKLLAQTDAEVDYIEITSNAISSSFPTITKDEIASVLSEKPNSQYVVIEKKLGFEEVSAFKELQNEKDSKIIGVWFEEDYLRVYPYDTLGSSIIGFTIGGNQGNWGLEQFYNETLNGSNGREYGHIDEELKLERTVKEAINGHTIISTIDANTQGRVQEHIKQFNTDFGSKNIGVLIMNPNNGEVLAMASNEEYDLNNPYDLTGIVEEEELNKMTQEEKQERLYQLWRNYAISDTFEPGSTFKPFTVAGALDEGFTHQKEEFYCDGHEVVGGWIIRCSNRSGHKNINLMESLMKSCNDVLMELVDRVGKSIFYRYQTFFGFGTKTGIDLPGEASGLLVAEEKIKVADLATSSFGQTFTTTMIQLATSYSSLVNGGYYYEPHMVKQIINEKGGTVKNIEKVLVKDTVTTETSDFMNEAMYQTVEAGTASGAQVPGYKVGGKTGTAQKYPRSDKTYVVSFIGSVPADDPEIVIYVVVDEPQNVVIQADSSIATKLASRILTDILPFLGLYPTEELTETGQGATPPVSISPSLPTTGERKNETRSEDSDDSDEDDNRSKEDITTEDDGSDENLNEIYEEVNDAIDGRGDEEEDLSSGETSIELMDDFNFIPDMTGEESQLEEAETNDSDGESQP